MCAVSDKKSSNACARSYECSNFVPMSIASVYCHPDRTVVSTWDIRENIPILLSLRFAESLSDAWWLGHESLPIPDAVASAAASCADIRIALPHSLFTMLRYPTDPSEASDERMMFEFSMNAPDVRRSTHALATFHGLQGRGATPWDIACALSTRVLDTGGRISARATIAPSFMAEAMAVQHCKGLNEGATALIGRRADLWETMIVSPTGELIWYTITQDDGTLDHPVQAREVLLDARAAVDTELTSVLVYGDGVTPDTLAACTEGMFGLVQRVARMNPFARVGADVDDDTKRMCIRYAHMLGPVVGQVLSPPWPAFPCASSAAR